MQGRARHGQRYAREFHKLLDHRRLECLLVDRVGNGVGPDGHAMKVMEMPAATELDPDVVCQRANVKAGGSGGFDTQPGGRLGSEDETVHHDRFRLGLHHFTTSRQLVQLLAIDLLC